MLAEAIGDGKGRTACQFLKEARVKGYAPTNEKAYKVQSPSNLSQYNKALVLADIIEQLIWNTKVFRPSKTFLWIAKK
jgi:hypothetical protein